MMLSSSWTAQVKIPTPAAIVLKSAMSFTGVDKSLGGD